MVNIKEFGKRVKQHRHSLGINGYNFAIAANIDFTYLSNIERGANIPTTKTVVSILNVLNMSFNECMNGAPYNIKNNYKDTISHKLDCLSNSELQYILDIAKTFH